jgi:pimeloyl-ACP methyl ester carboxylesterase
MRRAYANTPGGQIHYRERGSGPAVLLLHQTASSSIMWERPMRLLPESFRWVAMDTPGFGLSDPPATKPPGLDWYAGRVADFLDALELEQAHVVGHHTGAMIAAELAASRPERVDRLLPIGCVVFPTPEARQASIDRVVHWETDARGDFVVDTLLPRMHRSVTTDDPEHLLLELTAYLQAGPRYHWAYDAVYAYDAVGRLPLIRARTLCAVGEREGELMVGSTRRAAELIPGAAYEELDGGVEMAFQEPQVLAAAVARFLTAP